MRAATSSRISAGLACANSGPGQRRQPPAAVRVGHACGNSRPAARPWRCAAACRAAGRAARRTASRARAVRGDGLGPMAGRLAQRRSRRPWARARDRSRLPLGYRVAYPPAAGLVVPAAGRQAMGPRSRSGRTTRCSWCAPPTARSSTCPAAASSAARRRWRRRVRELREETGLEAPAGRAGSDAACSRSRRTTVASAPTCFAGRRARPSFPRADEREIVWAGFVPREQLGEADLDPLPRLYLLARSCSGAERHPPDVASVVAHRAVAREPAHVRGVEHRLGPPGRRARRRSARPGAGRRHSCRSRP